MSAPILSRRFSGTVASLLATSVLLSGCVSTRYKMARSNTPPPALLNLVVTQPPLEAALNMIIVYQGPGSWKRAAFWDEYVVTVHNQSDRPLLLATAALADPIGFDRVAGANPWVLEKESKTLEQKFRAAGVAFVRNVGPGVLIVGAGAGGVAAAGVGMTVSSGAVAVASATVVALPVYYLGVWAINSDNKAVIVAEFNRRRLALPLELAPGETRIGSLFFPMVPNPRSLALRWSDGTTGGELNLPLASVQGLHVRTPSSASAGK